MLNFRIRISYVDSAHHVLETVLNVLSISLNSFLLYLIVRHSNHGGKIYQVCLAVDAGLDLALGIACLVAQPVAFTGDGYLVMTSNAFSERRSFTSDTIALSAFYGLFHVNVLWIPMQFAYRYIVICRLPGAVITKKACAVALVGVLWNCVAFSVIFFMFSPPDDFQTRGLHVLQLNDWPYAVELPPPVFGSYITNVRLIAWLMLWFTSSVAAAIVVVVCEVKMYRFFREYGSTLSEHTRRLQKEFHRALLAMAICPLVTTGLPIFFFIVTIVGSLAP
ncbi:CRE-STR-45 protein, partial [Aphelenchoides avenae]